MNKIEVGKFIADCRKEKKLTQAQLAEKLNITDRAVSKWETGRSMPDSSAMLPLCEILGITVNELLSGEKVNMEDYKTKADENFVALMKDEEHRMNKRSLATIIFSITMFIGILTCVICDLAISESLTWSYIPVSSILFTWFFTLPLLIMKKRGILVSLLLFSILCIPFLFALEKILGDIPLLLTIGSRTAVIGLLYLWLIYFIWKFMKKRKWLAAGISVLCAIPSMLIIDYILSKLIDEPIFDIWDALSAVIIVAIAAVFFNIDSRMNKKNHLPA